MTRTHLMRRAAAQGVSALLVAVLLVGCAASPALRLAADDARPPRVLVTGVPFHPQSEYQCGPAALAMSLGASGTVVTADELVPAVFLPGRQGSVQPEMMAAPRRYGRVSYPVGGSLEALLTEVDAGRPVVVLQNLGLKWFPVWHYAVVIGYDLNLGDIYLHSGTTESMRMALGRFDRTWARSSRWAMLTLPPGELPATTDARTAITAIHDYEQNAGPADAAPAWVAATERWPEDELAWFARGNAHYARNELLAARDAFSEAVRLQPELGPGWINLGYLFRELGETDKARAALTNAAAIAGPWQAVALAELERLF
ncbi:MAG: PA2778 family cysteine peptidase [Xanthomonadaceae bacterium]|nr:PA2778 family cysteine peptidase [Xanthomonadaceae bacterium]